MSRKRKKPEDLSDVPVDNEYLWFWSINPIGGSGLGITTQMNMRRMSREILRSRELPIFRPDDESSINQLKETT